MATLTDTRNTIVERFNRPPVRWLLLIVVSAAVVWVLYELSHHSYLLFHSLAEGFSIVIAFAMFAIAWNSRRFMENQYLLLIGVAFVFIGGLDFVHLLAYRGMGVFPEFGTNPATQLWIAARYLEAATLLAAPLLVHRRFNPFAMAGVYAAVTALLLASIFFWHIFPAAYVDGVGLTTFKIVSEYVISTVLALSIWALFRHREDFNAAVFRLLVAAIIVTIFSELSFTLYTDPYGISNLVGHLLKIAAFYILYKALVATGLRRPYDLLFREQKQTEARLRESDQRLRWALRASNSGAWDWDLETGEAWWSPEMYRLWGVAPGTVMGMDNSLGNIVPGDRERVSHAVEEAIAKHIDYQCEYRITHAERGERWINSLGHAVYDITGKAVRMLGISLDITEHKKIENIKDEFIGLVSHELRTPMTVLAGSLHVALLPNITPDERAQMLRDALHSSEQLAQILDNLVELSRHQSGRLRLTVEQTDVRDLIRRIIDGEEHTLEEFNVSVTLADGLPSMSLDQVRVRQILRNLLSNAAKYSPAGSEIRVEARQSQGNIIISVADQGKGMTEAEKARLFQPFERLGESSTTSAGLGLGLLVCKRLVDAHGGEIWVESEPKQGSCFYFTLPVRQ